MLVLVFVGALILGLVVLMKKPKMAEQPGEGTVKEETTGVAPVQGGTANQTQTYTTLVKQYEGRRIQFDIYCQAIPKNVTYKNGTKVMFDNRSGDARIITIGGVQYNFPGYGYKVLTLSSNTLPKTLLLSCGAAVNVGQILLQR